MDFVKYCFFCIFVFLYGGMPLAHAKSLEALFIGNEAFRITDGEYVLFTDFPYKSGVYGYMKYKFNFADTDGKILSLITHRHLDHFETMLFTEQDWHIIGPLQVTIPLDQSKVLALAPEITYGPMTIIPKKTQHANVEHFSYLVKWQGRHMFFTGDTEELSALKDLPELDTLFITPWFYRKAKQNDALPMTEKIIIYHHRKKDIVPDCSNCIIPEQGDIFSIE